MPLPESALLSLPETVRLVTERTGEAADRVYTALTEAALSGAIVATGCLHLSGIDPARSARYYAAYFGHPALSDREIVPAAAWSAPISWPKSRVQRYDHVRFNRADIDRWLASAATSRQSEPVAQPIEPQAAPSGIRTNREAAAEAACRKWISELGERPARKDAAFELAKTAVESTGPLSRKAFERAWAIEAPAKWKQGGRRGKSPPSGI
jgi:hypothetical protein